MNEQEELQTNQYLFFVLSGEIYAVKTSIVQEIVDFNPIRKVPNTNKSILGITNIRGDLVTIVNPKTILSLLEPDTYGRSSFIIFRCMNRDKTNYNLIGLIVDKVIEIEDILIKDILKKPELATKIDKEYIENIIHYNNKFTIAFDIEKLLDVNKLSKGKYDE